MCIFEKRNTKLTNEYASSFIRACARWLGTNVVALVWWKNARVPRSGKVQKSPIAPISTQVLARDVGYVYLASFETARMSNKLHAPLTPLSSSPSIQRIKFCNTSAHHVRSNALTS